MIYCVLVYICIYIYICMYIKYYTDDIPANSKYQRILRMFYSKPFRVAQAYLCPGAVVRVGVQCHRLRTLLLQDLLILIQQTHRHLISAATVCPSTVPAR